MIGIIKTKKGDVVVSDIEIDNNLNTIKICFEQGSNMGLVSISTHLAKEIGFMNIDKLNTLVDNWNIFNNKL